MKRLCLAILAMFFFFFSSAQTDSTKTQTPKLLLEQGHLVRLVLTRDVGSSVAQEGNTIYFKVDSAVVISGTTVIPKDTKAYGILTKVRERKSLGQEGMFSFSINRLVLDNGRAIALTSDYIAKGRNTAVQMAVETVLLSTAFLFKKGKDITYKEGRPFVAFVAQDCIF